MGTTSTAGFTILETMLFLAITGLLIIGMIVGVGASIDSQRYNDGVQAFETLIQDQYSQLANVQIDHNANWTCGASAQPTQVADGTSRGQSNCVIMGRYMVIDQNTITTESVIGYQTGTSTTGNDIAHLKSNYTLSLSTTDATTDQMEWGTKLTWPVSGPEAHPGAVGRSFGILFITSPDSGSNYTFTIDSPPDIASTTSADLAAMLVTGNNVSTTYKSSVLRGQDAQTLCVNPNGLVTGSRMAVQFDAYATNQSAIHLVSNDKLQLQNGGIQC